MAVNFVGMRKEAKQKENLKYVIERHSREGQRMR